MSPSKLKYSIVLVLTAALLWLVWPSAQKPIPVASPSPAAVPAAAATAAIATPQAATSAAPVGPGARPPTPSLRDPRAPRLAYGTIWTGEIRQALAAFSQWAETYLRSSPTEQSAMTARGVALARERRAVFVEMIRTAPREALAASVPAAVRAALPAEVLALLETRVAGRGDLNVIAVMPILGAPAPANPVMRSAVIDGASYAAYSYGRREFQTTKQGLPLHGVALDGALALHESPVRLLDAGETLDPAKTFLAAASAYGVATVASAPGGPVNLQEASVVEVAGDYLQLAESGALSSLEENLIAAESGLSPKVSADLNPGAVGTDPAGAPSAPTTAAAASTAWTTGAKQVLVIRVDFSDLAGTPVNSSDSQPITAAYAQNLFSSSINPFYQDASYNKTSLTATASTTVYRLPKTAAYYAASLNLQESTLTIVNDARAAAATDYTLANYDLVVVAFSNLSSIAGSFWTGTAGMALIGSTGAVINGFFDFRVVAHELGHNYGLHHASLWQVSDGNPISANGSSTEYGDIFDVMSSASTTANHHFNHYFKNQLGWLPDTAVQTITTSGTYRVYRFDDGAASLSNKLALKVARDGTRSYWIGFRQKFTTNASLFNGAYIVWGTDFNQPSNLLDLTTPGTNASDCALAPSATLTDATYGLAITTIGKGGVAPNEYLDVQITFTPPSTAPTANPPNVGATEFAANWTKVPSATGYRLDVSTSNTFAGFVSGYQDLDVGLNTSGTVKGLSAGTTYYYRVRAVSVGGASPNSNTIALTTFSAFPAARQIVAAGQNVTLAVTPGGAGPFTYQWRKDGIAVAGATSSSFTVTTARSKDNGYYQVVVSDGNDSITSRALFVNVVIGTAHIAEWGSVVSGQSRPASTVIQSVVEVAGIGQEQYLAGDGIIKPFPEIFPGSTYLPYLPPSDLANAVSLRDGASSFYTALKSDGAVVIWGDNGAGQLTGIPAGLNNVVKVCPGTYQTFAVLGDGSIVGWGPGNPALPADLSNVAAVAVGNGHALAVKQDGTVVAWETALGFGNGFGQATVPVSLANVIAVAAGYSHSLALRSDGTVVAWGKNDVGQANVPTGLSGVVAIEASSNQNIALKSDGSTVTWGGAASYLSALTPPPWVSSAVAVRLASTSIAIIDATNLSAPVVTSQVPSSQTVVVGDTVNLSATVTGNPTPYLQWKSNAGGSLTNLTNNGTFSGVNTATLTISGITAAINGNGGYFLEASNAAKGLVTTTVAFLTVADVSKVIGLSGNLVFGNVTVNTTATRTLTISNTGNTALTVTGIAYPSGFSGPTTATVAAGGTTNLTVTFAPTAVQAYGGTVTATSDATSGTTTIAASGTGTAVPTKIIGLSGNLAFGNLTVNTTATSTLVIANTGNTALTVSGIAYPSGFSGPTTATVAAGGTTNLTVTFAPTAVQAYGGTVTVTSDATSGTNTLAASGTGTVVPTKIIGLSGNLAFGNVTVNTTASSTLVIANTGNTALTVTGIAYPIGFSGPTTATVAAGGTTNLTVTFSPTAAAQAYGGNVTVTSDKTSGTNTIAASGIGTAVPTKIIGLSGNLAFGNLTVNTTATSTLVIANTGNTALTVTGIAYPSGFSGPTTATVAAGGLTNLTVTFAPTAVQAYSGTVTVTSDATSGTNTLAASGAGVNGTAGDAGDFNGDGKPDLLLENSATGERVIWQMNGASITASAALPTFTAGWHFAGTGDFNSDGRSDIVLQNTTSGERVVWLMNGATISSSVALPTLPLAWQIACVGDLNNDGKPDIILQNTQTNERVAWFMNGTTIASSYNPPALPAAWQFCGIMDFSGDGLPDLLIQNTDTGERIIWVLNAQFGITRSINLPTFDAGWRFAGVGRFTADNLPNIVLQNTLNGGRVLWSITTAGAITASTALPTLPVAWSFAGPALNRAKAPVASDLNRDGKPDILVTDTTSGERILWTMNGTAIAGSVALPTLPSSWQFMGTGDFNADGMNDILLQNSSTGDRQIWLMNGTSIAGVTALPTLPTTWSLAAVGDINQDGQPDIVLENRSTGARVIWLMDKTAISASVDLPTIPVSWTIAAAGTFSAGGQPTLLLENTSSGERTFWVLNTAGALQQSLGLPSFLGGWRFAGAAPYFGGTKPHILLQNLTSGERVIWRMDNASIASSSSVVSLPVNYILKN